MKNILLGLLGAVVVATPVQAQSYDPMPAEECSTGVIVNFICHDEMDDGSTMLYAVPSGYSGRYVLFANKIPGGSYSFIYDLWNEQTAAYMYFGGNRTGMPNAGGRIILLEELEEEIIDINVQIGLYQ